jgi:hypothetical protein
MKLLFALAAVASAEKGRPDKIDAPKRLENLQNWSEKCLEELEGANGKYRKMHIQGCTVSTQTHAKRF